MGALRFDREQPPAPEVFTSLGPCRVAKPEAMLTVHVSHANTYKRYDTMKTI